MKRTVRVRRLTGKNTAEVVNTGTFLCTEGCRNCIGCQEPMVLQVKNPIEAKPGELVIIRPIRWRWVAGGMAYMLPFMLFFAGYFLTGGSKIYACIFLVLGACGSVMYHRCCAGNNLYTITGYGHLPEPAEKGDN